VASDWFVYKQRALSDLPKEMIDQRREIIKTLMKEFMEMAKKKKFTAPLNSIRSFSMLLVEWNGMKEMLWNIMRSLETEGLKEELQSVLYRLYLSGGLKINNCNLGTFCVHIGICK
jgi:hypothetical protein